eukprot:tig00020943_g16306.t1
MLCLASETELPQDVRNYMSTATDCGAYLQELISNILDVSLAEAKRLVLKKEPFDLAAAVDSAVSVATARAGARRGDVRVSHGAVLERFCIGDAGRLKQVLINLLSNALKYSEEGSPVDVEVSAPRVAEAQATLRIAITDRGIGIKPEDQARLFQLYSRVRDPAAADPGGCGIGLWLSRDLARLMGGQLECSSRHGQGSTFTLTVPFPLHIAAPGPAPAPSKAQAAAQAAGARKGQILLAEPSPTSALVALKYLEKAGHGVVHVATGPEAVEEHRERLQRGEPLDLVLLDTDLPQLSGYDVARRIREYERAEQRPPVPILAVSTRVLREDELRCYDAGMSELQTKPLQCERLLEAVARLIGAADQRRLSAHGRPSLAPAPAPPAGPAPVPLSARPDH